MNFIDIVSTLKTKQKNKKHKKHKNIVCDYIVYVIFFS